jgi:hypothetical protein
MPAKPTDRSRAMIESRLQEQPRGFSTDRPVERLDERGMRRQTLYLPPEVYEQIRDITISIGYPSRSSSGRPSISHSPSEASSCGRSWPRRLRWRADRHPCGRRDGQDSSGDQGPGRVDLPRRSRAEDQARAGRPRQGRTHSRWQGLRLRPRTGRRPRRARSTHARPTSFVGSTPSASPESRRSRSCTISTPRPSPARAAVPGTSPRSSAAPRSATASSIRSLHRPHRLQPPAVHEGSDDPASASPAPTLNRSG